MGRPQFDDFKVFNSRWKVRSLAFNVKEINMDPKRGNAGQKEAHDTVNAAVSGSG
jgi:hypothetical protein